MSLSFISRFKKGFPADWQELVSAATFDSRGKNTGINIKERVGERHSVETFVVVRASHHLDRC